MQLNPTIMSPSLTMRDSIYRGSARLFGKGRSFDSFSSVSSGSFSGTVSGPRLMWPNVALGNIKHGFAFALFL